MLLHENSLSLYGSLSHTSRELPAPRRAGVCKSELLLPHARLEKRHGKHFFRTDSHGKRQQVGRMGVQNKTGVRDGFIHVRMHGRLT